MSEFNNVISIIKAKAESALSLSRHNRTEIDRIKDSLEKINALMQQLKSYTKEPDNNINNKDPSSQVEL